MQKEFLKEIFSDARQGALIGIGISLIFMLAYVGLTANIMVWVGYIIFGSMVGFLISLANEVMARLFVAIFPGYVDYIFFQMIVTYIVSFITFYGITMLCNLLPFFQIPENYIFYVSMGVGIASVMVSLFFISIHEKEEKLRLEKENKELVLVEERNRIARELHDSVSQNLFGINLNLNTLNYLLDQDLGEARQIINQLQEMVQEVQTEMRLMIYELRPLVLKEKGFFEAVESLVNLFQVRYNLDINCQVTGDEGSLDSKVQLALYRVLQESLNNVVKHAKANRVKVVIKVRDGKVELIVQDNGRGFDLKEIDRDDHFGIKSMKERIEQVNGEFNIDSTVGKGTSIEVKI